jgi:class 3 adenylate cyclase/putative methionine-R-sulfoxide reductase with GAF domain
MEVQSDNTETYFEAEIQLLNKFNNLLQKNLTAEELGTEMKAFGSSFEHLIKQSSKLMKIGDSTQRRLIKTQNQLQSANEQIKESFAKLKTLSKFGQTITSSLDTKEIILSVYQHISNLMKVDILSFGIYEEDKEIIKYKFLVKDGKYVPSLIQVGLEKESFTSRCFKTNQEILVNDVETEFPEFIEDLRRIWEDTQSSLVYFPLKVEDRFIGILTVQSKEKNAFNENQMNVLRTLASYVGIAIDNADAYKQITKKNKQLNETLEKINHLNENLAVEREKSEKLLLNILPVSIAERLKAGESVIADFFPEATVFFADLAGFTKMSAKIESPQKLVIILNEIFTEFDKIALNFKLEKIKTIGDCYMLAGGIPVTDPSHTERVAHASLEMLKVFKTIQLKMNLDVDIRIGIHTGSVVAGVIGTNKFVYDLWGDTVNTASRMESSGQKGRVNCSEQVYEKLKTKFHFEDRGEIEAKGKGKLKMYFIDAPI